MAAVVAMLFKSAGTPKVKIVLSSDFINKYQIYNFFEAFVINCFALIALQLFTTEYTLLNLGQITNYYYLKED